MGIYEESLLEYMNSSAFIRVFHGKCPECGAVIWNVGEEYDLKKQCIKAKFICNCGKKSIQTVFSKEKGYKYRYPQGVVEQLKPSKDSIKVIKQTNAIYKVTSNGVKKKLLNA